MSFFKSNLTWSNYRIYTPGTILELPWAYNNVLVMGKPEDTWLNSVTIDTHRLEWLMSIMGLKIE